MARNELTEGMVALMSDVCYICYDPSETMPTAFAYEEMAIFAGHLTDRAVWPPRYDCKPLKEILPILDGMVKESAELKFTFKCGHTNSCFMSPDNFKELERSVMAKAWGLCLDCVVEEHMGWCPHDIGQDD